jgi:uncharacterized protein
VQADAPFATGDLVSWIEGTFVKLAQVLPQGAQLNTGNVIVQEDQAAVELHSLARPGRACASTTATVGYFRGGLIVRVRAHVDSALVARLFEENPIARLAVLAS